MSTIRPVMAPGNSAGDLISQATPIPPEIKAIINRAVPGWADPAQCLKLMQQLVAKYKQRAAKSPLITLSTQDQRTFERAAADLQSRFDVSNPTPVQRRQFDTLQKLSRRVPIVVPRPEPALENAVPKPTQQQRNRADVNKVVRQVTNPGALVQSNDFRDRSPVIGCHPTAKSYSLLKTAEPALLPVYASNDKALPRTYIVQIDLKKVSLKQLQTPATPGATASPANPRPEYTTRTASQWNTVANRQGRALAVFNTQFFDADAAKSTLSLPTAVDGKVVSAGKAEKGGTLALVWNNRTGTASIRPASIDPRLVNHKDGAHYLSFAAATSALGLNAGDNALVGFDAEKHDPDTVEKAGATYVGVTAQGQLLLLSTNTSMSRAKAATELKSAGATRVLMLDSGPSSFLNVADGKGTVTAATQSNRDRRVPAAAAVYAIENP